MTTDIGQVRGLLNDTIRDIIDLIGLDATIRLVEHLGGTSFDMPRGSRDSRRLRILQEILGADQISALLEIYGGAQLYIPRCDAALRALRNARFRAEVQGAVAAGNSQKMAVQLLAPKYGFSERRAYDILKETAPLPQPALFTE